MPILALTEARFDYTVPVVIIGAGACGLTAALAATEAGAPVLVLERDDKPTGSTALSTGLIPAAGTKLQRAHGIDDSPELLARDITTKAKGQNDPAIVEAVAHASGPTIDWLSATHDIAFTLVEGFLYPGHSRLRMHGTPNRTGTELQAALLAAIARLVIGHGRAAELLFTGRTMSAVEGERWGFWNRLANDPLADALGLARDIARGPSLAHAVTKQQLDAEWHESIETALDMEAEVQAALMKTNDFRRAYDAFANKRRPEFKGD